MNCTEAKQISIFNYLNQSGELNKYPIKNNSILIPSPLRNENTPSFSIDFVKNVWFDHGMGMGGSIIDLVCIMEKVSTKEALEIIQDNEPCRNPRPKNSHCVFNKFKIEKIQDIQHKALITYLETRMIDLSYIREVEELKEAHWSIGDKIYFGLAFVNDKGGHEVRNKFWKGCTSPKTITTIQGDTTRLNVFEGFFDYLSALTYYRTLKPSYQTIVLNGVGNASKIENKLHKYQQINCFLDNDEAGRRTLMALNKGHNNVVDQSSIYKSFNDFNAFLCSLKNQSN